MQLFKKIIKISLFFFIFFILLALIDILKCRINSVDDISNLTKIKMYDDNNQVFYEVNNLHESTYVRLEDISEITINTFIQVEDKHFYDHSGFNIYSITRAFFHNIQHDDLQGGSTITQQYVKNIYLNNKKSLFRKIREAYFAIKLERIYSKEEILEGYLNTIYFDHGIYGIYDASRYYFNKDPKDLNLAESACLVAIIKSPTKYAPDTNYQNNCDRKIRILNTLLANKVISNSQYQIAINKQIFITKTPYQRYSNTVLFYKDLVLREIKKMAYQRKNLDIYTSFNTSINKTIDHYLNTHSIYGDCGIIIENNVGQIIATIGNKNYSQNSFNIAVDGKRMIGSTIKPMLYYEALNHGMTSLSKFTSAPCTFYIKQQAYTFNNFNNNYENCPITMAYALATSDNIYAVKTHLYLGSSKLINFLKKFNIDGIQNYPSLALGTVEMSLLELVQIYHTFSTLGVKYNTSTIREVRSNDKTIYLNQGISKKMLDASTSFIISELLTGTFDTHMQKNVSVTGARIANSLNCKVAAKSGLTDYDAYIVGYTPEYTIGIWTGNKNNELLTDTYTKQFPKNLFAVLINQLMAENKNIWYEQPNDVYALFTSPTGFDDGYKKNIYFKN